MPEMDGIETAKKIRSELNFNAPILLMTASNSDAVEMEAEQAGIQALITKPLTANTLLYAITHDIFQKKGLSRQNDEQTPKLPFHYIKRLAGLRVLIAEDNTVNQDIAKAELNRVGIDPMIVGNGQEAVEAVSNHRFDVVLMDIYMPVLDGLEATKTIRSLEKKSQKDPKKKIPIIAMTALAMQGDERKALKAGMDGYVTKPINQKKLFEAILNLPAFRSGESEKGEQTLYTEKEIGSVNRIVSSPLPGIDIENATALLDLEEDVFKSILIKFFNNNKDTCSMLQDAYDRKDPEALLHIAHSLRGSAAGICAYRMEAAARKLEEACQKIRSGTDSRNRPDRHLLTAVIESLTQVMTSLHPLKKGTEETAFEKPDQEVAFVELAAVFTRMRNALQRSNPLRVAEHFSNLILYLEKKDIERLQDEIDNFEYPKAIEILSEIASKRHIPIA